MYPSGKICLSTLDEEKAWHPSMTAAEILLSIQAFLDDPNFSDVREFAESKGAPACPPKVP